MFNSSVLEVAIGVIFIFLLVSLMCSAIREAIEALLKTRATFLEQGLRRLLKDADGTTTARHIFEHPLISSLYNGAYTPRIAKRLPRWLTPGGEMPSYIPSRSFALALLDIAARGPETNAASGRPTSPQLTVESVRANIENVGNPWVQRCVLTAIDTAEGDLQRTIANVEAWFDSGMERVSGWYKRSTHWILFVTGLVLAVALNVDTIRIADYLFWHDAERSALVAHAQATASDSKILSKSFGDIDKEMSSLSLPIGWQKGAAGQTRQSTGGDEGSLGEWPIRLLGWLLTALAATIGAPFWFDVLKRVCAVRSTVKVEDKKPDDEAVERRSASTPAQSPASAPVTSVVGGAMPAAVFVASAAGFHGDIDGCGVGVIQSTADEDLPEAEGGVA